jgi:hypothetical protein
MFALGISRFCDIALAFAQRIHDRFNRRVMLLILQKGRCLERKSFPR